MAIEITKEKDQTHGELVEMQHVHNANMSRCNHNFEHLIIFEEKQTEQTQ